MPVRPTSATTVGEQALTRTKGGTLQAKFTRVMLGIMLPFCLALLVSVTYVNYRANQESARETQRLIRAGIVEKARVLTENHALALRGMVADNAFGDVSSLVEQAAERDPDIVYGLFLAADDTPWAYISPTQKVGASTVRDLKRYTELRLEAGMLHPDKASERAVRLFNQEVLEFAAPVSEEGELLGTIRYGFSTRRMHRELATARARADQALNATLLTVTGLTVLGILLGMLLVRKALRQVSKPLNELTAAAYSIAEGRRDVRVQVSALGELEILAAAFNHMIEVNQRAFEELEAKTEQALESARLKSEFLANMSHEIRTPMNGVMGLVKLMLGMPLDDKLRRYAETMDASSTALLTIINDVLDFSKMEAGKYTLHEAPFEPRIVVQDVAELLCTRATEKGLEIIYRVAKDVPERIKGDADRFRQVLNNLVGNAVKFTETGEIFVELRVDERTEGEVVLRVVVNDTGIGIAESDVGTIFDAFSQVDGSMVRKHGGTGLGLAISKRLIEMMGGSLGVWSRPGMGSQFWFTMRSGFEASAGNTYQAPHTGRSALVIEGNHRWREIIREHMEAWGMLCETVPNVQIGLPRLNELLRQGKTFDVVVAGLPTGAFELQTLMEAAARHAVNGRVPLIVVSQSGNMRDLSSLGVQAAAQLHKPLRMSELYNSLQSVFTGHVQRKRIPSAPKNAHSRRGKVLVVDDNRVNQFVAAEQLQELGYVVDVADDGAQALEKVRGQDYAVVLMDCQMPVMDGYTATREIRQIEEKTGKHQLIIALTAHAMTGERERVMAAGMDDYLSKPLRGNALERMLARYSRDNVDVSDSPPSNQRSEATAEASAANITLGSHEPSNDVAGGIPVAALDPGVRRSVELLRMCLQEMPAQVSDVIAAVEAADTKALRAAAHKLKGAALALAASPLASVAERLQHSAEAGKLDECVDLTCSLQTLFEELGAALSRELSPVSLAGE